jgi:hypothetical protein
MPRARFLAGAAFALGLALAGACGKSKPVGLVDGGGGGSGGDGGLPTDGALAPCLDQPGLQRPPVGQLPCELLPPNFGR